ncbi:MAG: low temperature requirement protein A [Hyphomonadaceae bacterium]
MSKSLADMLAPKSVLRDHAATPTPRVTNMELFFDLVYVFTIIQLSHFLLHHQSLTGALEAVMLFAAVWWTWNYTAWATNWLDPDHKAGRIVMVVLMACALGMAIAIPQAFKDRARLFAGAYVLMSLIRPFYMALAFRGQRMGRNYLQLGLWSALSGVFWIAGALLPQHRIALWAAAVIVDYAAPYAGFWLPGLGATSMASWPLKGLHLLERNQLIFIIALGESVLLLGGTLVSEPLETGTIVAAVIGFLIIVCLWWIYFGRTFHEGEHAFEHASDHSQIARAGLAYAHGILVGSAIVVAASIELIIAHPHDAVHLPTVLIAVLGPAIFLLGNAIFRRVMSRRVPVSYLLAAIALAGVGAACHYAHLSGLWLGAGVLAVLVVVAAMAGAGRPAGEA